MKTPLQYSMNQTGQPNIYLQPLKHPTQTNNLKFSKLSETDAKQPQRIYNNIKQFRTQRQVFRNTRQSKKSEINSATFNFFQWCQGSLDVQPRKQRAGALMLHHPAWVEASHGWVPVDTHSTPVPSSEGGCGWLVTATQHLTKWAQALTLEQHHPILKQLEDNQMMQHRNRTLPTWTALRSTKLKTTGKHI